jgi:hypothetical protein
MLVSGQESLLHANWVEMATIARRARTARMSQWDDRHMIGLYHGKVFTWGSASCHVLAATLLSMQHKHDALGGMMVWLVGAGVLVALLLGLLAF